MSRAGGARQATKGAWRACGAGRVVGALSSGARCGGVGGECGGRSEARGAGTARGRVEGLGGGGGLPGARACGTSAVDLLSQQLGLPLLAKFRAQYERAEAEPAPPPPAPPAAEPRRAAKAEPAPAPVAPVGNAADAAAPQPGRMQLGNVRSGQQLYAENCDLTVMATVGAGAEVIADGSIHIYGTLRGRALAGAQGNTAARIFCRDFHAELVAIAGHYKVLDDVPDNLRGKAVQVWLEQDQIKIAALD